MSSNPLGPGWLRRGSALAAALLAAACGAPAETPGERSTPPSDEARRPPNVVLFLVDDLGWHDTALDLGGRPAWLPGFRTPHLARLASEGMTFTEAYAASPVCTPTRVSILTGAHPARLRITNWTLRGDPSAPHPTLAPPDWNRGGLSPVEGTPHAATRPTLPELLARGGYRTLHVGKAHFGALGTPGADPLRLGFEVNVAGHAAGAPGSHLAENGYSARHRGGDGTWDVPGLERWSEAGVHLTEALTREALEQAGRAVDEGVPFFLHLSHYAVHTPIEADPRFAGGYPDRPPVEAAYASLVEGVDASLGELLDFLDERGIADETLVWFLSDNGGLSAHGRGGEPHVHNAPLRSGKGSGYEGGVRVPMVVRWPGVTPPGSRRAVPVHAVDVFPTLLAAAARPRPADLDFDGEDLTPLLAGAVASPQVRSLYWHYPHQWGAPGPGIEPYSAVRRGRWKLLHFYADGREELYDLEADPGESTDLAAAEPELARSLARRLGSWLAAVGGQPPLRVGTREPVPLPGR